MYLSNYIDSTYSLTLTVKNPCNDAQLTIPTLTKKVTGTEIELFEAREWGGQVILQYEMPYSDVGVSYGPNVSQNQWELCGDMTHYVTT